MIKNSKLLKRAGAYAMAAAMVIGGITWPGIDVHKNSVKAEAGKYYTIYFSYPEEITYGESCDVSKVGIVAMDYETEETLDAEALGITCDISIDDGELNAWTGYPRIVCSARNITDTSEEYDYIGTIHGSDSITGRETHVTVNPKELNPETDFIYTVASKEYDGTKTAEVTVTPKEGVLVDPENDHVVFTATAEYDDRNVGTGKTVLVTALTVSADSGEYIYKTSNYSIGAFSEEAGYVVSDEGVISKNEGHVYTVVVTPENYTYNGETAITACSFTGSGADEGDDISVDASAVSEVLFHAEQKDAGITSVTDDWKITADSVDYDSTQIAELLDAIVTGSDKENYTLALEIADVEIYAKELEVSYGGELTKIYDGTTDIYLDLSDVLFDSSNLAEADRADFAITSLTGIFDDKNAGSDIPVTITYTCNNANYILTDSHEYTGSISRKEIGISILSVEDKVYDGTNIDYDVTMEFDTSAIVTSEQVSLDESGMYAEFSDAGIGNGKAVTVRGYALTGADAGNYMVPDTCTTMTDGTTATAAITLEATISVPNASGVNRDYVIESDGSGSDLTDDDLNAAHAFSSKQNVTVSTNFSGNAEYAPEIAYAFVMAEGYTDGVGTSELAGLTYTAYTDGCRPDADGRYYIYLKVTDCTGGVIYYGEAGALYDDTDPLIDGVSVSPIDNETGSLALDEAATTVLESYSSNTNMTFTIEGLKDDDTASYYSGIAGFTYRLMLDGSEAAGGEVTTDGSNSAFTLSYARNWEGKSGELILVVRDIAGNSIQKTYAVEFGKVEAGATLTGSAKDDTVTLTAGAAAIYTRHTCLTVVADDKSGGSFEKQELVLVKDGTELGTYKSSGKKIQVSNLEDGVYTATLKMITKAGVGKTTVYRFVVDNTLPTVSLSYSPAKANAAGYVSAKQITLNATVADAGLNGKSALVITVRAYNKDGKLKQTYTMSNMEKGLKSVAGGYTTSGADAALTLPAGYTYAVSAVYTDKAGNQSKAASFKVTVDGTKPVISVTNDTPVASTGTQDYYAVTEKTTITVTERNFSAAQTKITVLDADGKTVSTSKYSLSSWTETAGSSDTQDDTEHTATITFTKEGDYRVCVEAEDAAGNKANSYTSDKLITVDKTNPVIAVSYSPAKGTHGSYFDQTRTATITVTEHNFDPSACTYTIVCTDVNGNEIMTNASGISSSAWTTNGDVHTATVTFEGSYHYSFTVNYTDYAKRRAASYSDSFTVDKTAPNGTITIGTLSTSDSLSEVTEFTRFTNEAQNVTITAEDTISPLEVIRYYVSDQALSRTQLEGLTSWTELAAEGSENRYTGNFVLDGDAQTVVYVKLVDYAGKTTYIGSDGVIFDNTDPAPVISIETLSSGSNGTDTFYNGDVSLKISVEDPTVNGAYAGLSSVRYEVYADGEKTAEGTLAVNGSRQKNLEDTIRVSAEENNTNNVELVIYAEDLAGNSATERTAFAIDVTAPTVTAVMSRASSGSYYGASAPATATITVTERNFDSSKVVVSATADGQTTSDYTISGWTERKGATADATDYTATITFNGDADYEVSVGCTDLADNSATETAKFSFTVDQTMPLITFAVVDGEADGFYNEGKNVVVTVTEHNFDSSQFTVTASAITADSQATAIQVPQMSDWTQNGDVYTAQFELTDSGVYSFKALGSDIAGNAAATAQIGLSIDRETPTCRITINGEEGDAAAFNDDEVTAVIAFDDGFAIDVDSVKVEIKELISGRTVEAGDAVITENAAYPGYAVDMTYTVDDLPNDGLYVITVNGSDAAGNAISEVTRQFAISRSGSIFYLKLSNEAANDTYNLVKNGYITRALDFDFVIREFNPSKLGDTDETTVISVETLNHGTFTLTEGVDYTVTEADPFGGDGAKFETIYAINPSVFDAEDQYIITIISEDSAGNKTNSNAICYIDATVDGTEENVALEGAYRFVYDATAPTALYEGIANATYNAEYLDFIINTNTGDLSGISNIKVTIAGTAYSYGYDAEQGGFVAKDAEGNLLDASDSPFTDHEDGTITVRIPGSDRRQTVSIDLTDFAGNESETVSYTVMISTSWLARLISRTWLFVISILALLLLLAALVVGIILIARKKK